MLLSSFLPTAHAAGYELLAPSVLPGSPTGGINLANYASAAFGTFLVIVTLAAIGMTVWGGIEYLISQSLSKKQGGRSRIVRGLGGLLFALSIWLFLNTLNPSFLNLNLNLPDVGGSSGDVTGATGASSGVGTGNTAGNQSGGGNNVNPCTDNNKTAAAYIVANEGYRNSLYNDSLGKATIGIGHLVTPTYNLGTNITDAQVTDLFNTDYNNALNQAQTAATNHGVNFAALSPNRQAVLVDMAFNMGALGNQGLSGFNNMFAAIRQAQVTNNQADWNTAGQQILNSTYGSQVRNRAASNAAIMATDNSDIINTQINNNSRAASFCQ